ncbi:nucleotidyltransferase domain-containing protein [bacterium]|nr:nucleotidyltransferase domain-containing protein [bacterium]MBU1753818.1 nucleotidyltransferase domain-containing protein [bacterium]
MNEYKAIIQTILAPYPDTQAIYSFGTHGTEQEWPESDVDIAVLLPPKEAKQVGSFAMSKLHVTLEQLLGKDVDLINLRQVSTVFQKEITIQNRRFFCADNYAADEFEMLVLSFYQKLNEERRQILDEFWQTGRAYKV